MALCRFYQQGYCKFGSSCRFEHPSDAGNNRNQSSNRFGALGGGGGPAGVSRGDESSLAKYSISAETIEKDLTIDAPQWILSAYAPGRDAPDQLFGGYPREQSFEELRLHYLAGKASGNEQQALNEAQQLYQNAKQQMESAARNTNEAAQFIVEGENRHPNRHDVCKERTQGAPFGEFLIGRRPSANPFGGNTSSTSAFGQPSALGQPSNPFGQPSQPVFGQPSQPTSSFGQPSQPTSAFGQPAQTSSPFAKPPQESAFGQPSGLGVKPSPFGSPAFGQASQPNTQNNPFGQPQVQNSQASAFGQPSQLGQKPNPFASAASSGASPFATAGNNNNAPAANPFSAPSSGQAAPSPFASNNTPSPFGQPTQQQAPNPFGQPSAPAANPFAATNQGSTQNASNPFAQQPQQQQQQQQQQPSPFGAQANQPSGTGSGFAQSNASPFGKPSASAAPFGQNQANGNSGQSNAFAAAQPQQQQASSGAAAAGGPYRPGSTKQHPPLNSYSSKGMDGRLTMFKGKPATYKNGQPGNRTFDGTWTRIWFPDGPPPYNKDTELPPGVYGDRSKAQWVKFAQTGAFADDLMPDLPPPREFTQWDF